MTYGNARSGPNNVNEYVASGLPWVSSSGLTITPWKIDFPYVTNNIYLKASGSSPVRIGFTQNGVNGSSFVNVAQADGWVEFNVRCRTVYLRADFGVATCSLMVGLTTIEHKAFPELTGSGIYNSAVTSSIYGYGKPGDPGAGGGLG